MSYGLHPQALKNRLKIASDNHQRFIQYQHLNKMGYLLTQYDRQNNFLFKQNRQLLNQNRRLKGIYYQRLKTQPNKNKYIRQRQKQQDIYRDKQIKTILSAQKKQIQILIEKQRQRQRQLLKQKERLKINNSFKPTIYNHPTYQTKINKTIAQIDRYENPQESYNRNNYNLNSNNYTNFSFAGKRNNQQRLNKTSNLFKNNQNYKSSLYKDNQKQNDQQMSPDQDIQLSNQKNKILNTNKNNNIRININREHYLKNEQNSINNIEEREIMKSRSTSLSNNQRRQKLSKDGKQFYESIKSRNKQQQVKQDKKSMKIQKQRQRDRDKERYSNSKSKQRQQLSKNLFKKRQQEIFNTPRSLRNMTNQNIYKFQDSPYQNQKRTMTFQTNNLPYTNFMKKQEKQKTIRSQNYGKIVKNYNPQLQLAIYKSYNQTINSNRQRRHYNFQDTIKETMTQTQLINRKKRRRGISLTSKKKQSL